MPIVNQHFQPEHGLQIEETHEAGDQNGVYHLFRYWYAWVVAQQRLSKGATIWDLGCGSAYGARIMAEQHEDMRVFGFDNDPVAGDASIEYADQINLGFEQYDLDRFWAPDVEDMGDQAPDLIVCYDLISFLRFREVFLLSLACAAEINNALVLFSTHIVENTLDLTPAWREKKIDYCREFITSLLSRFFESVIPAGEPGFLAEDFRKKYCDYAGYPVGEDIIICENPR